MSFFLKSIYIHFDIHSEMVIWMIECNKLSLLALKLQRHFLCQSAKFFFYQGFLSQTLTIHRTAGEERGPSFIPLYHCSRTLRHLFATLHVRWLSRIFNRNACAYQTATWWDLPPYQINIWLIDWWCNVCLFTWWIDSRILLQRFWTWETDGFELASTITLVL